MYFGVRKGFVLKNKNNKRKGGEKRDVLLSTYHWMFCQKCMAWKFCVVL